MKFNLKSSTPVSGLVLAVLLATAGVGAMAQSPAANTMPATTASGRPEGGMRGPMGQTDRMDRMDRHDPAKMQAFIARRQAEMKAKLKITPAQEGAWTRYTAAMQPSDRMAGKPTPEQRAEFERLTTPQRIDRMKEMRSQRMAAMGAAMDKRGDATKALYAALSPEQQKVFDMESMKHFRHGGRGSHGGPGGPGPQR